MSRSGTNHGNGGKRRYPPPSSEAARQRMRATRQRNTSAEMALRSALHRKGLRYRVDFAPLAGLRRRADVVFRRQRVAVFVDGCFWHGCPQHASWPKSNAGFWRDKILANRRRDVHTNETLEAAGWLVIRIWEHEDAYTAAEQIDRLVRSRSDTNPNR